MRIERVRAMRAPACRCPRRGRGPSSAAARRTGRADARTRRRAGKAADPCERAISKIARSAMKAASSSKSSWFERTHDAGVANRAHVVIPARTMLGAIPVRRPVEVGGIDVGRQPLLESMQLIGSAEVHLAGENGAIAARAAGSARRSECRRRTPPHCRRRRVRDGKRPDMNEARDGAHNGLAQ